jgi:hypothetical protein
METKNEKGKNKRDNVPTHHPRLGVRARRAICAD